MEFATLRLSNLSCDETCCAPEDLGPALRVGWKLQLHGKHFIGGVRYHLGRYLIYWHLVDRPWLFNYRSWNRTRTYLIGEYGIGSGTRFIVSAVTGSTRESHWLSSRRRHTFSSPARTSWRYSSLQCFTRSLFSGVLVLECTGCAVSSPSNLSGSQ